MNQTNSLTQTIEMNQMSFMDRVRHNEKPIPSIEGLTESEEYKSMIKFDIDAKCDVVGLSAWIIAPPTLITQYLGEKKHTELDYKKDIRGLKLWYSYRGTNTKIILIPKVNCDLLSRMGVSAQEFINYFEHKDDVTLINSIGRYRVDGVPDRLRKQKTKMMYYANNDIYITMKKVLG